MQEEALGVTIGLVIKGITQLGELKKGFKQINESVSQTNKSLTAFDNQKLTNLQHSLREARRNVLAEFATIRNAVSGGIFALPIKLAMNDEAAFANVKKYVDDSAENMQTLKAEMRNLSSSLGLSFERISEIAAGGGKINLKGGDLLKYTRMLATGATAFEMSAEDLSRASNNMKVGFKIKDLDRMNELFDAINLLDNTVENVNAKEVFEATSLIAANSNLIGLNEKSAAAISSTMLSTGKATSVVGTSLNALFTRLDTAESQSKAFQEALKQIGLDAKTLKANLQKDAEGTIVDFLDRINKAPKQMRSGLLYDLVGGNFNDEIAALVMNVDALKENLRRAYSDEAKGSMKKELQTKLDTTASAIERLKQSALNLAAIIGETFLPMINSLANSLGSLAAWVQKLAREFPTLTKVLSSAVAGFLIFKPVWLLLKIAIFSVIDGFVGMVKILKILNPLFLITKVRAAATAVALKAQAVASWLVGARLRFALVWTQLYNLAVKRLTASVIFQRAAMIAHAVASKAAAAAMAILRGASIAAAAGFRIMKLALITTGIGAIVVGLATAAVWLYENWDRVKAFFQNFWQKIKPEWESFKSWLDSWIEAFSSVFDETVAWWKDLFADFFGWIGEKIDWVLSSVKSVGEFFGFGDNSAPVMTPAYANADRNFTPAPNHPMGEALSTLSSSRAGGSNTNITFNGDFKIDAHGGSIDTEAFKRQISKDIQEAIRRNEQNAKNTDVRG